MSTSDDETKDLPGEAEAGDGFTMSRAELRVTQTLAAAAGVLLVAAALWTWVPGDAPTSVVTIERTLTTSTARAAPHARARVARVAVDKTTTTMAGDVQPGQRRAAPVKTSRRSELLAVVLAGGGALLLFVGLTLPRLRGATGPRETSFSLAPLRLARARVRRKLAADSRLTEEYGQVAIDVALHEYWRQERPTSGWWRRLGRSDAARPLEGLDRLYDDVDRVLEQITPPPSVVTGWEQYQGDRFEGETDADERPLMGRVTYQYGADEDADHDVLDTGIGLRGETVEGQSRIGRIILQHATGNRTVTDAAVARFVDDFETVIAKPAWQISLADVQAWTAAHVGPEGQLVA